MSKLGTLVVELAAEIRQYLADLNTAAAATEATAARIGGANASLAVSAKGLDGAQMGVVDAAAKVVDQLGKTGGATDAAATKVDQLTDATKDLATGQKGVVDSGAKVVDQLGKTVGATEATASKLHKLTDAAKDLATGQADVADVASLLTPRMMLVGGAAAAAAAVVAGYGLASYKAAQENTALVKSLALSGNQAGVTAGQLQGMAAAASQVVGTHGQAAQAIDLMVSSGKVAGEDLQALTVTALNASRAQVQGVDDTVKAYTALGDAPAKASAKLNESMGYLNAETYRRIKALEEMGQKDEAAALAQQTYARALDDATKKVEASLGYVQRSWRAVGKAADWAWDKFLGLGRTNEVQDSLTGLQQQLDAKERQLRAGFATTGGGAAVGMRGMSDDRRGQLEAEAEALREQIRLLGRAGATAAANAAESVRWHKRQMEIMDEVSAAEYRRMTNAQKLQHALAKLDAEVAKGDMTHEQRAALAADAERQFADKVTRGNDGLRERNALLKAQQQGLDDLVKDILAREKAEEAAVLATAKAYDQALDRQNKATASAEQELERQLDLNAALGLGKEAVAELEAAKLEETAATKERQAALEDEIDKSGRMGDAYRDEAAALYALAKAKRDGASKQAGLDADKAWKKQADKMAKEGQRAAQKIEDSLTDALMRGFESGKGFAANLVDTVANMFKTLVLRPVVQAIVSPVAGAVTGMLGLPGMASAGQSAMGQLGNAASVYSAGSALGSVLTTAGQGLSSFTTALTAGAQSLVGLSGTTAQMTASLQAAGYWTGSAASTAATTAGASAGSTLVAAAPYAAAALVVLNALGAFRKTKTVGSGLMGELGGEINSYDLRRKSGTLFSGPDYSIRDNGLASQNQALQDAFKAMRAGAIQVADAFDISAEGVENFTTRIGNELINPDTGGYGLKLEGLNEQEIQAKVQAALATANDAIAAEILGIKTVTVDTIKRTVTEVGSTWDDGYTTITREVEEQVTSTGLAVRRDLLPWMQRIADASGPTAATLQAIAAYPDQLLQLAGTSRDALVQAFGQGLMTGDAQAAGQTVANQLVASIELSMMGNASAQIFDIINRGIVTPMIDALLTGQSVSAALSQSSLDAVVAKATATAKALGAVLNDPAFAAAMDAIRTNVGSALSTAGAALSYTPQYQIQPATIATTTASAGSLGDAVDNLREKFDSAETSLADTGHSLAIDLVRATGDEMTAQRMEREQYLAGFADLTAEEQRHLAVMYDQNQATRDQIAAIEKANAVAEQKAGLERQLLDLNGDTAAIRALELATIDPANRELQESIWARQDEKKAAEEATRAAEEATRAAEQLANAYASLASAADSTADKYLSGSALTDYRYSRFAERANGITGGSAITGDVLQALGIADIQAAVLDFVRGNAAPEAKQAVLELGASLIDLKQSAIDAATAAEKAAAATAAEALAKAQATLQQIRDKAASESERLSITLAQMLGQTAELRALELSKLEPANRALQQYIWTLEDQAAATEAAAAAARSGTDDAYSALDRAVSAQRKIIETQRAAAQSLVQDVSGIFDSLQGHVRDLFGEVDASMQWQAAQGRAFIDTALAGARAGSGLPDADDLAQAISAARGGLDAQAFGSQAEADFARLVLANELKDLQDISGLQLSEAERQLQVAESQLTTLDGTLEAAKAQIDALRGVDTSVMSVEAAIVRLSAAVTAEEAAAAGGAASSAVEQAAQAYGASVVTYSAQAQGAIDAFLAEIARLPGQVDPGFLQNQVAFLGSTFADVPAFDVGTNYVPRDMLAQIHEGEAILPEAFNPWAGGILPGMRGADNGGDARAAAEIKLLREENAAQARALVLAVKQLEKLQRRWEVEGMPATRNETGAPTAEVLVL